MTTLTLDNMAYGAWIKLTPIQRDRLRDNSGLQPQLIGLEGWRVEVRDHKGDKPRRFIVGKSTGWRPLHLELARVTSHGGAPAKRDSYYSVTKIEKVR